MEPLADDPSPTRDETDTRPFAGPKAPATLQSLLVHVDAGPHAVARLHAARRLAQRHDATVTGYYAAAPLVASMNATIDLVAGGAAFGMLADVDRSRRDVALARVEALRDEPGVPVAWQEAQSIDPIRSLARRSLYSDLLVLGQHAPTSSDWGVPANFVESVVIESGSPALVLPHVEVQKTLAQCVLVAWKETASSGRALRAALPLLQRAEEVHVVSWGADPDSDPKAVTAFLQRHGIDSRLIGSPQEPEQVGERLLSLAAEVSADLMVMGCYGHSRARELVLGGATRTILRSMTLPVLMAH